MTLTFTDEQEELRSSVRRFVGEVFDRATVRALAEQGGGIDRAAWTRMAVELGLQGLTIAEELGGSGCGPVEACVVFEELGRGLACSPFFSTTALAVPALVNAGDDAAAKDLLPSIADGTVVATVAICAPDGTPDGSTSVRATGEAGSWRLDGTAHFVTDALAADLILVIAESGSGPSLFAVHTDATTVERAAMDALDLTRPLGRVTFSGTSARLLGAEGGAATIASQIMATANAALAAEHAGGAARCLEMAVGYAKARVQFERPIGSFQAIKHKCADMLLDVEATRSAAIHAAFALAAGGEDRDAAVAVAAAFCPAAYLRVAGESIQIHGGIGYTWEHDAHLYFRRAMSSKLLWGGPDPHLDRLVELSGTGSALSISFTSEDETFRADLRAFLRDAHPGRAPKDAAERLAFQRAWAATKVDRGWAGPSWPKQFGGMELPFAQQVIYQQETAGARLPAHPGTGMEMVGPTIIRYGTDAQKERYLPPMLRGDELWAQAFSEPEAGSDLPSLRTTADLEGEGDDAVYVVNGQKVWISSADIADMFFTLVRTGPPGSRQHGITYLLIDAHSPGVTTRPLRDMTGAAHFAEIFFDDVRVPVANRIGQQDEGWQVTRTTLGHERMSGALNQGTFYRRVMAELIALARERGALADGATRRRLAELEARARIMEINGLRAVAGIIATGEPGATSSISRLYNTVLEKELHVVAVEMLGAFGALGPRDDEAVQRGRWVGGLLRTRASTIGAGTAEIQRNTIAEQVLGLPYDPAMPPR